MVKNAWKRVLAFVLAFAMVVCDAGVSNLVYAADEDEIVVAESTALAEDGTGSTESEAMTYLKSQLKDAWDAGIYSVEIDDSYGVTVDMLDEAYDELLTYDYNYFYVSESYGFGTDSSSGNLVLVNIYYGLEDAIYDKDDDSDGDNKLTAAQLERVKVQQSELKTVIENIVAGADSSWSELEIVLYLNDYLAVNCQYDEDAYENNNTDERMPFTVYGALVDQICVCQGYARAFMILARELGLNAELVRSASLGHEWNAVEVDGTWYMLDVTWDDPVTSGRYSVNGVQINDLIGRADHTYFLKSYSFFRSTSAGRKTHLSSDDWTYTGGLTADDIAGNKYDSDGIWEDVNTSFIYDADTQAWYTINTDGEVLKCVYDDTEATMTSDVLTAAPETSWIVVDENSPTGYSSYSGYFGFGFYDGKLFYSTTDTIYSYDLSSKKTDYFYGLTDAKLAVGEIVGMKISSNGYVTLQLSESPAKVGTIYKNSFMIGGIKTLEENNVALSQYTYTFDGTEKKPTVTVMDGTLILDEGTHYRVEYDNDRMNAGTVNVTVTGIGDYNGTVTVSYEIEKATITNSSVIELDYGESQTISTLWDGEHSLADCEASSSNTSVATIVDGTITAVGVGEATITYVLDHNNYDYFILYVKVVKIDQVLSTNGNFSISYGQSTTLSASTTGDGAISFTSSNTAVATVNSSGVLTAVGVGTATITVTTAATDHYNGATRSFTVTVTQIPQSLSSNVKGSTSMYVGDTTTWSVTTNGDGTISYTTSDSSIATISSTGVVTAKGVGQVTIYAQANAGTNYSASSRTTLTTILVLPGAPSGLTLTNTSSGVKISWNKVSGASGYYIYRGSSAIAKIESGSTVTYTDSNAKTSGTSYTYKILPYYNYTSGSTTSAVLGKESSTVSIKYLSQGKISSLTNVSSGVKVKWSKVTGAGGYYIYRGSTLVKTITSGSTTSWTDTSAKSGTTYKYYVMAYSGSYKGVKSSAKSIKRIGKGTVKSLTNVSSGVTVKWSKVTGAKGYYIYRGSTLVKTITSGSTTSWTDTSVKSKNGSTYTYYVTPYSGSYKGVKSSGVKTVRLTAVTISSVKNSSSKAITVKYKKNSKATGYEIQYSTSKSFSSGVKTVTISKASTLSTKVSSLKKGKTYYVRVRAYKKSGSTKYYSAYSSTKSVKVSK